MKRLLSTAATALILATSAQAATDTGAIGTMTTKDQADFYASNLIGMRVYSTDVDTSKPVAAGAQKDWDDIGEINDLVIGDDGQVDAVILGVGGFLGIGEKDVAVKMDAIKIAHGEGDHPERFLVVDTSKDALENAPAFEHGDNTAMMKSEADVSGADHGAQAAMDADSTADDNADTGQAMSDAGATAENAAAPTGQRPSMKVEGYSPVKMEDLQSMKADDLEGAEVYGTNKEHIGDVNNLVVDKDGKISKVIIDVGGFLGIGAKPVAISFDEIEVMRAATGGELRVYIDASKDTLESLPKYEG